MPDTITLEPGQIVVFNGDQVLRGDEDKVRFVQDGGTKYTIDKFYMIRDGDYVKVGYTDPKKKGDGIKDPKSFVNGRLAAYKTHTPGLEVVGLVVVCAPKQKGPNKSDLDTVHKNLPSLQSYRRTKIKSASGGTTMDHDSEWFSVESRLFHEFFNVVDSAFFLVWFPSRELGEASVPRRTFS